MAQIAQLELLDGIIGDPRSWWSASEHDAPTTIDKFLHYLICYYCDPSSARRALRLFNGIDHLENDVMFSSWNEVRVSTLRDIQRGLELSGCRGSTWELAITIKDFLQNLFDTIGCCLLDDELEAKELLAYFKQLQGLDTWEKEKTPYRPLTSTWSRKNARKAEERILPDAAIQYLKYLLGRTTSAPFDYHCEKVLTRLGMISPDMHENAKRAVYNQWLGAAKPISKHRKLLEFSKLVCLEKSPRCGICPLNSACKYATIQKCQKLPIPSSSNSPPS